MDYINSIVSNVFCCTKYMSSYEPLSGLYDEALLLAKSFDILPRGTGQLEELIGELTTRFNFYIKSRSRKAYFYESWPSAIGESGIFNCAGILLIGAAIFESLKIPSLIGICSDHVVNILDIGGEYHFLDLGHETFARMKIVESETVNTNLSINILSERILNFGVIAIAPLSYIIPILLGNLCFLREIALGERYEQWVTDAPDELNGSIKYYETIKNTVPNDIRSLLLSNFYDFSYLKERQIFQDECTVVQKLRLVA
jgi:hypothetical protein